MLNIFCMMIQFTRRVFISIILSIHQRMTMSRVNVNKYTCIARHRHADTDSTDSAQQYNVHTFTYVPYITLLLEWREPTPTPTLSKCRAGFV